MEPGHKTPTAEPALKPRPDELRLDRIPLWEAIAGMLAVGALYAFLPQKLLIGPGWLLLVIETVFFCLSSSRF